MLFKPTLPLLAIALASHAAADASTGTDRLVENGVMLDYRVVIKGVGGEQGVEFAKAVQEQDGAWTPDLDAFHVVTGDGREFVYRGQFLVAASQKRLRPDDDDPSNAEYEKAVCRMEGQEPDEKTVFTFRTRTDGLLALDKCGCAAGTDNTGDKKARLRCEVLNGEREGQGLSCDDTLGGTCHLY